MRPITTVLSALTLSALVACAPDQAGPSSAIDSDEALSIAETALTGLNEGDYDAWTAAWSDEMKAMLDEEGFVEVRAMLLDVSGPWQSIDGMALVDGNKPRTVRWEFDLTMEREPATLRLGFEEGGTEVIGVFYDSENLRALSE